MLQTSNIVVLTGPMGGGKSTAGQAFSDLGIRVIDLDDLYHEQLKTTKMHNQLKTHFPSSCFENNRLILSKLRAYVTAHPEEKQRLENLTHPLIMAHLQDLLQKDHAPYTLIITPLYHGLKAPLPTHRLCLLQTPLATCLMRIKQREGFDQSMHMLAKSQWAKLPTPEEADDLLINDQDIAHLKENVRALHQDYLIHFKQG